MYLLKSYTEMWWLILIRGLIGVILGIAAIAYPGKTLMFITVLIGVFLLLDGVMASVGGLLSIKKSKSWWVLFLQGLIGIALGWAIFSYPDVTLRVVFFLVAVWAILMGITFVVIAIITRSRAYGGWLLAATGLISLAFGIFLLSNPVVSVQFLTVLVGLYILISGVFNTAFAFEMRAMNKDIDAIIAEIE